MKSPQSERRGLATKSLTRRGTPRIKETAGRRSVKGDLNVKVGGSSHQWSNFTILDINYMAISLFMKTSWGTIRFTLLILLGTVIYSGILKPAVTSMDIADLIEKKGDLGRFIRMNFDSVEYVQFRTPLPFMQVNLVSHTDALTFCTMNVQQCWVKRVGVLYAFFMLIRRSDEIEKHISKRFGIWETRGGISIGGDPPDDEMISWNAGPVKIDVSQYINVLDVPKYEMCDLVVCGNMTYRQLLEK